MFNIIKTGLTILVNESDRSLMSLQKVRQKDRGSDPAACELVEQLLVQLLVGLLAAHAEKDVAADKLVDDLAVGREALEDDVLVVLKLDHHVPRLPVDVPCLGKETRWYRPPEVDVIINLVQNCLLYLIKTTRPTSFQV